MRGAQKFAALFHRRSLTFAVLGLMLCVAAANQSLIYNKLGTPPSFPLLFQSLALFVISLSILVTVTINLIRDVDRGYSPQRCSLASLVLLFAFAVLARHGIALWKLFERLPP